MKRLRGPRSERPHWRFVPSSMAVYTVIASVAWAAEPSALPPVLQVSTSAWVAAEAPVYCDPDDDWAKDPSVITVGDTWYMYYTSANPWQGDGSGGKGPSRIDVATSSNGLHWVYQGVAIPKGQAGEWDEERPQAPAKPILRDGTWYMYYAGKSPRSGVVIGYATSTNLFHWTKPPGNPVLSRGKCNDPFIFFENGVYVLFYTSGGDSQHYVTSTNLIDWSAESVSTGTVGEGSIVIKDGPTYTLLGCIGWSHQGEYYKAYTSDSLTKAFVAAGDRIRINTPDFAAGSLCHGDIVRHNNEYWFYFQATRDRGKRFQIGLARQPVPDVRAP